jgi:hypothetical protein
VRISAKLQVRLLAPVGPPAWLSLLSVSVKISTGDDVCFPSLQGIAQHNSKQGLMWTARLQVMKAAVEMLQPTGERMALLELSDIQGEVTAQPGTLAADVQVADLQVRFHLAAWCLAYCRCLDAATQATAEAELLGHLFAHSNNGIAVCTTCSVFCSHKSM